ncbi:hypothetical protein G647_05213 [Cladophialophora carrionii CBS 160.54]|uniref:Protein-lysine N-methyltransferase EFM4 n=1 Tax=Cladophialophora carrionii CBS 160.54 TaxID=1279043 RepID=V9D9R3_9EURO|nr:uncharacterized protein G647_05213 [Cladophialophora carrionii CBS 160.54]ETI23411.1 hypothetical protein G647_05213 [Cladophialophora carrionii CBS 160.54]
MPEVSHPTHLEPSELGTKEYWDEYYERDLDGDEADEDEDEDEGNREANPEEPPDPSELDSWFDDVGAPAKTLAFLTSTTFPLSPNYSGRKSDEPDRLDNTSPAVLDLGTGNGSALFSLHLQGGYTTARMVGVDYSRRSIELAEKLRLQYAAHRTQGTSSASATATATATTLGNIAFYTFDVINEDPKVQTWWPRSDGESDSRTDLIRRNPGFDLVLDKGTFDAISLSSDRAVDPNTGLERRICELYPAKVLDMTRPGGFLLLTSCNWTESEVISWFTGYVSGRLEGGNNDDAQQEQQQQRWGDTSARFEVYDTIKYPVFEFGGQKGQGVATVCFRKVLGSEEPGA